MAHFGVAFGVGIFGGGRFEDGTLGTRGSNFTQTTTKQTEVYRIAFGVHCEPILDFQCVLCVDLINAGA